MANINNNKRTILDLKLKNDEYWDFMLSKDLLNPVSLKDIELEGLASFIDFKDSHCILDDGKIQSLSTWKGAINEGVILKNIGITGVDNGFITYKKDRISNEEFLNLYLNTRYEIPSNNKALFLTPIASNTLEYHIPLPEWNEKGYVALKGGFYQGFFKLHDKEYQTLPHYLGNEWNIHLKLRPQEYDINEKSLNALYPNNKNIFFYIGTRAENKFWKYYNTDKVDIKFSLRNSYTNNEYIDDLYSESGVINEYYCMDMTAYDCPTCDGYFDEGYYVDNIVDDTFKNYFEDGYFNFEGPEYAIVGDYIQKEISLENLDLETENGYEFEKKGYFEIESDNKFLLFNRTETGYTISNWDDTFKYSFTGRTDYVIEDNYFNLFNQTATGYTVNTIRKYLEEHVAEYDIYGDVKNNALAFKINDNGSITYRYMISDCNAENGISVIEETSKPNVVKKGEWNNIHIKMKLLDYDNSECYMSNGKGTMKIYVYVNGFLKLISQELPEIQLKPLKDVSDKQEGVPYNLSIGGGTQGLMDTIDVNYYKVSEYILPLEENFAGSFIGDIENFKFYDYPFSFYEIQNLNH